MDLTKDRSAPASLYERDFVKWAEKQAAELRRLGMKGHVRSLDFLNLAEEIEGLARSERSRLKEYVGTVLEHLLKLQASPAKDPRDGWSETIDRTRASIHRLLEDSPSLLRHVPQAIRQELPRARRIVASGLKRHGETPTRDLNGLAYTAKDVLGEETD